MKNNNYVYVFFLCLLCSLFFLVCEKVKVLN